MMQTMYRGGMQVTIYPEGHVGTSHVFLVGGWEPYEDVSARVELCYRKSHLLATFTISEPELRRMVTGCNQQVCEDSCAEVFLKVAGGDDYVNIETSASGAVHGAVGPDRHHRRFLDESVLKRIPVEVMVKEWSSQRAVWVLREDLDLAALGVVPEGTDLKGLRLQGNFYTCGDKLKKPIWLLWNQVDSLRPDFHRPDCFGDLLFM